MKVIRWYTLVLAMLSLAACAETPEPVVPGQQEAAVREAIAQTWQQFIEVWEQGDAAAAAMFYTEDVINILSNGVTQNGRAEVETLFADFLSSWTVDVLSQTTEEVFVQGDLAYEVGILQQQLTPSEGDPAVQQFPYVSVFKRQSDGNWKWYRWMGLSDQ